MKKGDKALTPQAVYTGTKAAIEALLDPQEGWIAQQTDAPYAQGRYANGAWNWGGAGGGTVDTIVAGDNIAVDATDPANPVVALDGEINTAMKEPTGFPNRTDSIWSLVGDTLTIEPAGGAITHFDIWFNGVKHTISAAEHIHLADTEGIHAIYFDTDDTLQEYVNPTIAQVSSYITEKCAVALVYWDATNNAGVYVGEERHGCVMDGLTHFNLHYTRGLQYISGLALGDFVIGNGSLDTHAQFSVATGLIADEDIGLTVADIGATDGLPILYKLGANAYWRGLTQANFAVYQNPDGATNRLMYNQYTGGAWQLTEVSEGDFVLCHLFATTGKLKQIYAIMGQVGYTTLSSARAGAQTEISDLLLGNLPSVEMRPVATVLFQTDKDYGNTIKARVVEVESGGDDYISWLANDLPRGAIPTSVSVTAPITGNGTPSSPIEIPAATAVVDGYATAAQITKLDGIAVGANAYVHPNHSGDVTSVADGAQTIAANAVTLAKLATQAADTVLANATSGAAVPTAVTVAEQTLVGRITGGRVDDLSASQVRTLLNVADGANAYVHPNHSGDVTSVADGAQTIAAKAVTLAKMNDMATASLIYRKTAGAGAPEVNTLAQLKIDLGVIDDAPSDSAYYGRLNATWTNLKTYFDTIYAKLAGLGTQVFSVAAATDIAHAVRADQIQTQALTTYTTAGTSTDYTLTTLGIPVALTVGERWHLIFHTPAGSHPTLNRDGKGAKALKYYNGAGSKNTCSSSTLVANRYTDIVYDGTNYVVLDPFPYPDGNYGDIAMSGNGYTLTIPAGTVTLDQQANMATASLVYRKTAGAGAPEVQTLATLKTDLALTYPTCASIMADELLTSYPIANFVRTVNTGQPYNFYCIVTTANANNGDIYTGQFFLAAGTYTLHKLGYTGTSRGTLDTSIDGSSVGTGEVWYAAAAAVDVEKTIASVVIATSGYHTLTMTVNGKHASSTDYTIALTKIWLTPASY